jgi:hypothetical protein
MNKDRLTNIVTAGVIAVGCLIVALWLFLPFPFSPLSKVEGPVSQEGLGGIIVQTPADGLKWHISSTEWQDIPGLSVAKLIPAKHVFIFFESEMLIESLTDGIHSGFVRLLINGKQEDIRELRATVDANSTSKPGLMLLTWAGEFSKGANTVTIQAKVSDDDTTLKPGHAGDMPKLMIIR